MGGFSSISPEPFKLETSNINKNLQNGLIKKNCNGEDIVVSTVLVLEAKMYS